MGAQGAAAAAYALPAALAEHRFCATLRGSERTVDNLDFKEQSKNCLLGAAGSVWPKLSAPDFRPNTDYSYSIRLGLQGEFFEIGLARESLEWTRMTFQSDSLGGMSGQRKG